MRVAIVGYGTEGKSSYDYWTRNGDECTIVDEREQIDVPEGAKTQLGQGVFGELKSYDLVVRSPGVAPRKIQTDGKLWSATNEFFEKCPAPIIGVTGTKGKGTTCSLIVSILRAAGRTAHLVGNIGVSALEVLPKIDKDDIVVYELSSFQLWDLKRSPHVAVVLMIEPDHLDVHRDFDEYVAAKSAIAAYQSPEDVIVYNASNLHSRLIAERSPASERIEYPFDVSRWANEFQLPGMHNRENLAAAVAAAKLYVDDDSIVSQGAGSFQGLPHRLDFVAEHDGIRYFDDSISTTPGSAIAALASFEQRIVIILGGSDKGANYESVIRICKHSGSQVIAIGQTGESIAELCAVYDVPCIRQAGDMVAVVNSAKSVANSGDVVVLSPASASFDQYCNYVERGEGFVTAVMSLK